MGCTNSLITCKIYKMKCCGDLPYSFCLKKNLKDSINTNSRHSNCAMLREEEKLSI
jgi:hypothetical protein